jgi:hypothetical protein
MLSHCGGQLRDGQQATCQTWVVYTFRWKLARPCQREKRALFASAEAVSNCADRDRADVVCPTSQTTLLALTGGLHCHFHRKTVHHPDL